MAQNDGGPAFPIIQDDMQVEGGPGMSLRDYFAGQAFSTVYESDNMNERDVASWAYKLADAMLAARDRRYA